MTQIHIISIFCVGLMICYHLLNNDNLFPPVDVFSWRDKESGGLRLGLEFTVVVNNPFIAIVCPRHSPPTVDLYFFFLLQVSPPTLTLTMSRYKHLLIWHKESKTHPFLQSGINYFHYSILRSQEAHNINSINSTSTVFLYSTEITLNPTLDICE